MWPLAKIIPPLKQCGYSHYLDKKSSPFPALPYTIIKLQFVSKMTKNKEQNNAYNRFPISHADDKEVHGAELT